MREKDKINEEEAWLIYLINYWFKVKEYNRWKKTDPMILELLVKLNFQGEVVGMLCYI
ncbi:MAG TPA: hypothetical protein VE524_00875 [Nitrososphaeraceae archaeon]|nr:hypothetical protein [Nitrososphaeraceae archaeon]